MPPKTRKQPTKENAILSYANRLQKHLYNLTTIRSQTTLITKTEKNLLNQIILNLPPNAKKELSHIQPQLYSNTVLEPKKFDELYSQTHDWIYTHILQVAFGVTPLNQQDIIL